MSFVDMAYLRKKDLNNGICPIDAARPDSSFSSNGRNGMQEIADKYNTEYSTYLLPVIS